MQLGGIGDHHSAQAHQVTKCLHSQEHHLEGDMKLSSPGLSRQKVMQAHLAEQDDQTPLSLMESLRRLLQNIKGGIRGVWQGGGAVSAGEAEGRGGSSQVTAQESQGTGVPGNKLEDRLLHNPYFAAVEPPKTQGKPIPVLQSAKSRVKAAAGRLAGHLPGQFLPFQKQGSFQAGKEGRREDPRKRSRYREDQMEIDCILTDESYLLDSYDRKGEYSQLTTRK